MAQRQRWLCALCPWWQLGNVGRRGRDLSCILSYRMSGLTCAHSGCADRRSQSSRDGIEPLEQMFSRSGSSDEAYGSASELNSRYAACRLAAKRLR